MQAVFQYPINRVRSSPPDCNTTDPLGSRGQCLLSSKARHVTGVLGWRWTDALAPPLQGVLRWNETLCTSTATTLPLPEGWAPQQASSLIRVVSSHSSRSGSLAHCGTLCLARLQRAPPRPRTQYPHRLSLLTGFHFRGHAQRHAGLHVHGRFRQLVYINGLEAPQPSAHRSSACTRAESALSHSSAALLCATQPPALTAWRAIAACCAHAWSVLSATPSPTAVSGSRCEGGCRRVLSQVSDDHEPYRVCYPNYRLAGGNYRAAVQVPRGHACTWRCMRAMHAARGHGGPARAPADGSIKAKPHSLAASAVIVRCLFL